MFIGIDKFIARSRSDDVLLSLWSLTDGHFLDGYSSQNNDSSTCLSSFKELVALGTASGTAFVFNTASDKLTIMHTLNPQANHGPVRVIRFNHECTVLVTGHDVGAVEVSVINLYRLSSNFATGGATITY